MSQRKFPVEWCTLFLFGSLFVYKPIKIINKRTPLFNAELASITANQRWSVSKRHIADINTIEFRNYNTRRIDRYGGFNLSKVMSTVTKLAKVKDPSFKNVWTTVAKLTRWEKKGLRIHCVYVLGQFNRYAGIANYTGMQAQIAHHKVI